MLPVGLQPPIAVVRQGVKAYYLVAPQESRPFYYGFFGSANRPNSCESNQVAFKFILFAIQSEFLLSKGLRFYPY